jgi:hypothetical protein
MLFEVTTFLARMVEHKEKDNGREGKIESEGEHGGRIRKGMT